MSRAARLARLEEALKERTTPIVVKVADYARPVTAGDEQSVGAIERPRCPKCDARVAEDARYCRVCGAELKR